MPPNDSPFFPTGVLSNTQAQNQARTSTSNNDNPIPDTAHDAAVWVLGRVKCYSPTSKWLSIEPRAGSHHVYLYDVEPSVATPLLLRRRAPIEFLPSPDDPTRAVDIRVP